MFLGTRLGPHTWSAGLKALVPYLSSALRELGKSIHAPAQLPGSAEAPVGGEARDPHSRKHHGFQITPPKLPPTGRKGDTHLPGRSSRSKTWERYGTLLALPPLRPPLSGRGKPGTVSVQPIWSFSPLPDPHAQGFLRGRPHLAEALRGSLVGGDERQSHVLLKVLQPC